MGIIEPLAIGSAMAAGVVELPGGAAVWLAMLGVVAAGVGGFAAAALRQLRAGLSEHRRGRHPGLVLAGATPAR